MSNRIQRVILWLLKWFCEVWSTVDDIEHWLESTTIFKMYICSSCVSWRSNLHYNTENHLKYCRYLRPRCWIGLGETAPPSGAYTISHGLLKRQRTRAQGEVAVTLNILKNCYRHILKEVSQLLGEIFLYTHKLPHSLPEHLQLCALSWHPHMSNFPYWWLKWL